MRTCPEWRPERPIQIAMKTTQIKRRWEQPRWCLERTALPSEESSFRLSAFHVKPSSPLLPRASSYKQDFHCF
jgi:hypothetical protein